MYDCELLQKGEKQIVLHFCEEKDVDNITEISGCLNALKKLMAIVHPLAVEFRVMCQDRVSLINEIVVEPEVGFLRMVESLTPPGINIGGLYPGIENITKVQNITTEALLDWMVKALDQESPDPEKYNIHWGEINIWAVRARIIDEAPFQKRNYFRLHTSIGDFEYPLERRKDGLWVYGPRENLFISRPPFAIQISTMCGAHKIRISVYWTRWYDANSSGYNTLKEAISRIIDQGWELSESTPLTDPVFA